MAYTTVVVLEHTDKLDGVASGEKQQSIQSVANFLQAALAGAKRGVEVDIHANDSEAAAAASGTATCAAVQDNDTVTINGTALTATQHHARGTVTITIANTDVDDTVTIEGEVFTAKSAEDTGAGEFDISGDATAAATSLVACIAANATLAALVTAASAAGVVTIRAIEAGTGANALTLESSDADGLTVSAATLTGGAAVANNEFDFGGTDAQTATALAAAVNASTTALISGLVTASASDDVVTLTAAQKGRPGNAYTLASSDGTRLAVTGARLTGGTGGDVDGINFTL